MTRGQAPTFQPTKITAVFASVDIRCAPTARVALDLGKLVVDSVVARKSDVNRVEKRSDVGRLEKGILSP